MTAPNSLGSVIEWVPLRNIGTLHGAHQYERPLNDKQVARIAADLDPVKFGTVTLALRDWNAAPDSDVVPLVQEPNQNGKLDRIEYLVVDGQHRLHAMVELGWTDQCAPAVIEQSTDTSRQAEVFLGENRDRRAVHACHLYRAAVEAGHADECAVDDVLRSLGLRAGTSGQGVNVVSAVGALVKVYRNTNQQHLRDTLRVLRDGFGPQRQRFASPLVEGMAWLMWRYPQLDSARLTAMLLDVNPRRLVADARASAQRGRLVRDVADQLLRLYNGRRRPANRVEAVPEGPDNQAWVYGLGAPEGRKL